MTEDSLEADEAEDSLDTEDWLLRSESSDGWLDASECPWDDNELLSEGSVDSLESSDWLEDDELFTDDAEDSLDGSLRPDEEELLASERLLSALAEESSLLPSENSSDEELDDEEEEGMTFGKESGVGWGGSPAPHGAGTGGVSAPGPWPRSRTMRAA